LDINKPIYLVLITGVIISSLLFASALALHITLPNMTEVVYTLALMGAAVLILTPYLRVAVALGAFLFNREYKFAILSLVVLLMMVISFISGFVFHIAP
jgi:uncharacterized membrane protein